MKWGILEDNGKPIPVEIGDNAMDRGYVFAQVWIIVYQQTGNWADANDEAQQALKWFDRVGK